LYTHLTPALTNKLCSLPTKALVMLPDKAGRLGLVDLPQGRSVSVDPALLELTCRLPKRTINSLGPLSCVSTIQRTCSAPFGQNGAHHVQKHGSLHQCRQENYPRRFCLEESRLLCFV
jgi:hypothetical protein